MKGISIFSIFFFLCFSCSFEPVHLEETPARDPVLGAWSMQSVHWITADTTYKIEQAQPGLFLFTDSAYSIMWTPTSEPRIPFAVLSKPTDDEILQGFRSIVFNGGSYTKTDSTLISTAIVAKVPGFEGGIQLYRYVIDSGRMELTMYDEIYPDGSKPDWSGNFQTRFFLEKLVK